MQLSQHKPEGEATVKGRFYRGCHHCFGGCGKLVSANKKKCVSCMAQEVFDAMKERGDDPDLADIKRLILVHG